MRDEPSIMNRRSILQAIAGVVVSLAGLFCEPKRTDGYQCVRTGEHFWGRNRVSELAMTIDPDGHLLRVYWMPVAGQCDAATEVWRRL